MTVWIVRYAEDYIGGVYSTHDKAMAALAKFSAEMRSTMWEIEEWEVE